MHGGEGLKKDQYAEKGVIIATEPNCGLIVTYSTKSNMYLAADRKQAYPHFGIDNIYVYFIEPTEKFKSLSDHRAYASNVSFDLIGFGANVEVVWYDELANKQSKNPKILGRKTFSAPFPESPVRVTIPDKITGLSIEPLKLCFACNYGIDNLSFGPGEPLIAGQLRVVDPQDGNKVWNIDKVLQGTTEKDITTVTVIPKDMPDKPLMILSVDEEGKFSSQKTLKGSENSLVDGKEYILRASLKYEDHITVGNTLIPKIGCAAPPSNKVIRIAIHDVELTLKKEEPRKPVNINYPLPIILLHGINACWAGWDIWASKLLSYQRDRSALIEGYIVFTPNYQYIGPIASFHEWGTGQASVQLMTDLSSLFNIKPQVNLICHSNGGVIARLLSRIAFGSFINKIYTLGTPYTGTKLPGAKLYRLSFDQMGKFNEVYPNFGSNVTPNKVFAISGEANNGLIGGILTTDEPNDGIVYPQQSSYSIFSFSQDLLGTLLDLKHVVTFNFHPVPFFHSNPPGSPAYLDEAGVSPLLETLIISDLNQNHGYLSSNVSSLTSGSNTTRSVNADSKSISLPIPTIFSQEMQIDSHVAQEVSIVVPNTEAVSFMSQPITTKTTFTLIDPSGTIIKPNTATSYPGARYGVGGFLEETINIQNPKPGIWKMRVTSIGQSGKANVMALVASKWVLIGGTDQQTYAPSSKATIRTKFAGDFASIKVDSVTATIKNVEGADVGSVNLVDKGNGIYEGLFAVSSVSDTYHITFEASGIDRGKPFKQLSSSDFNVMTAKKVFTGTFADQIQDMDGDGKPESITEKISLNIPEKGLYTVQADLFDAGGALVTHAVEFIQAKNPGLETLVLNFNMSGASCLQLSNSLQIKNLIITAVKNDYITLDTWTTPIQITKYSGKDFGLKCENEPKQIQSGGTLQPQPIPPVSTPRPRKPSDSFSFSLNGNLKTDVQVNAGDSVTLSASGSVMIIKRPEPVYCRPDGIVPTIDQRFGLIVKTTNQGVLLARITNKGDEKWIVVGSGKTFIAPNSGVLELQVNDKKYQDNEGNFDVRVKIDRAK